MFFCIKTLYHVYVGHKDVRLDYTILSVFNSSIVKVVSTQTFNVRLSRLLLKDCEIRFQKGFLLAVDE